MGETGTLVALLLAGHALADFLLQSDRMVRRKEEWRWLGLHVLVVLALQTLTLIPYLSPRALAALAGVAVSHGLIDRLTVVLKSRWPGGQALLFTLDQALHVVVLLTTASWLAAAPAGDAFWPALLPLDPRWTALAVTVAAYAFNWNGGSAVVILVLERFRLPDELAGGDAPGAHLRMGRAIGILERMVLLTLVLLGQWGALGLALAFKSIARFKDLDQRHFSEYYLIGTLTSLLVAIASGLVVRVLI